MSFTPINTQEEFDNAIKDRIAREKKKYEGYMSPDEIEALKGQLSKTEELEKLKNRNTELEDKLKGFERNSLLSKVAEENGLPKNAAQFLKGDTEEELEESAKALADLFPKPDNQPHAKAPEPVSPVASNQLSGKMSGVEKKFREMNPGLKI